MRTKLRLKTADEYAYYLSAYHMAEMLVDFLEGRSHSRFLANEYGDIAAWDDIVIGLSDAKTLHIQAKRQLTDFSTSSSERQAIRVRVPKSAHVSAGGTSSAPGLPATAMATTSPRLSPLSPFDEAIRALANYFDKPSAPSDRIFWIEVPDWTVMVKKDFNIRVFEELCATCKNPTVTPQGLELRAQTDDQTKNLYSWLTTWCEFKNWAHIHSALRYLTIKLHSLEAEIEARGH